MKQNLRFILLTLLCAVFSSAWGQSTATFTPSDFSGQGTSGSGGEITATVDGITFSCDKGYGTTQIRCYSGGKITISSSNTINAISFTFSGSYTGGLETSYTNLSTNSWEKTLSSQARITEIVVTYSALGPNTPVITPKGGFFISTQTVAMSADEGCSIYYTLNSNDDPTSNSTLYEGPFTINATTTVKAIAVNSDDESSNVVSATFTKISKPLAPSFNPETDTYIKAGTRIYIIPNNQSVVNGVVIIINDGEPNARATSGNNYVEITEEMADEQGKVKIEAYNTYTLGGFNSDGESLEGEHATATYFVVDPVVNIDTPSTVFIDEIDVTLSASPENATIIYTTDGSNPTTSTTASEYSSPIHLEATTTIKAFAVMGDVKSEVKTATYTLSEPATAGSENWIRIANEEELQEACTNEYPIIFTNHEVEGVSGDKKAMSKIHSSNNNRAAVDLSTTLQDNAKVLSLTATEEAAIAQLKCIYTEEKGYQWYDPNNGYFQASTSNKNQFNCYQSDNTNFKEDYTYTDVTFNTNDDGKNVTVKFKTEASAVTRHYIQYNESNSLFSAYTGSQQAVSLYYKGNLTIVNLYEKPSEFDITSDENTIETQSGVTVNLYRSLTANVWNAICLPFDLTEAQMKTLFGEGYKLEEFSSVEDGEDNNGNTTLNFTTASEFKAGKPYIVLPTQSVDKGAVVVINRVNIDSTAPEVVSQTGSEGSYTFQGFYNPYQIPKGKQYIFIGANNQFRYSNSDNGVLRGFRCYFHLPTDYSASGLFLSTDDEGIVTNISLNEVYGLDTNITNNRVYSISGQCVGTSTENLPKGIYIVNGRKFIVK